MNDRSNDSFVAQKILSAITDDTSPKNLLLLKAVADGSKTISTRYSLV